MRTGLLWLSDEALAFLAQISGNGGKWFLPQASGGPGEWNRLRKELEQSGLARQGFDGKLHPIPKFSRMLYNLGHVEAALLLEREEGRRLYLRGPVDVLVLEQEREKAGFQMALRPFYEMCREVRSLGEDSFSGRILTWEEGQEELSSLCLSLASEDRESRIRGLKDCLASFCRPREKPGTAALPEETTEGEVKEDVHI